MEKNIQCPFPAHFLFGFQLEEPAFGDTFHLLGEKLTFVEDEHAPSGEEELSGKANKDRPSAVYAFISFKGCSLELYFFFLGSNFLAFCRSPVSLDFCFEKFIRYRIYYLMFGFIM